MRLIVALVAALALSACATRPADSYAPTTAEAAFASPAAGKAVLVVKRDPGFTGSACTYTITVDREKAAMLRQGQEVTLHVTPGERILAVDKGAFPCGGNLEEIAVMAEAGKRKAFRVWLDQNAVMRLSPTAY